MTSLLDHGADIEAKGVHDITPLQLAALNNDNPAVVRTLLDNGANIEAKSDDGGTPLHAASHNENPAVVRTLLDNGANIQAKDNSGATPWTWQYVAAMQRPSRCCESAAPGNVSPNRVNFG